MLGVGNQGQAPRDLFDRQAALSVGSVGRLFWQVDICRKHVFRIPAFFFFQECPQTAGHDAGRGEQSESEGDLADDEGVA